jgi:hypothetical protein
LADLKRQEEEREMRERERGSWDGEGGDEGGMGVGRAMWDGLEREDSPYY